MQSVHSEIRQFIIDNFLFGQGEKLTDGESFLDKGIIDSTGVLELVGFLQERYSITIDDDELVPLAHPLRGHVAANEAGTAGNDDLHE